MLHVLAKSLCLLIFIFIYCEFLIYYLVLLGCSWPQLSTVEQDFTVKSLDDINRRPLHVMFIADTHLLGSREGHWFDKLRREWQMYRSFQSARFLFEPHIIFFLGDLTDEGKWCSDQEWETTVQRFHSMFAVPSETQLYVLAGNHDIGFHYDVSDGRLKRFEQSFQTPHVRLINIDDHRIQFVLINSVAFEGDQCRLCQRAEKELDDIVQQLNYKSGDAKPILLSHFPLYRPSDANCSQWTQVNRSMFIHFLLFSFSHHVFHFIKSDMMFCLKNPLIIFLKNCILVLFSRLIHMISVIQNILMSIGNSFPNGLYLRFHGEIVMIHR